MGAPMESAARKSQLSLETVYTGGVIGEYALWRFIDLSAEQNRMPLFGFQCAQSYPICSLADLGGDLFYCAADLRQLLDFFMKEAQKDSTGALYSLNNASKSVWLMRESIFGNTYSSWQVEQYMLSIFIQVIRLCAGRNWLPSVVYASSKNSPQVLPSEWAAIDFRWGCKATAIKIEKDLLLKAPIDAEKARNNSFLNGNSQGRALNLYELIYSRLQVGKTDLQGVADGLGKSTASLKRQLKVGNTTYSQLLERARYNYASELLEGDSSIDDIAQQLGYEHHSNFTRAFKKSVGYTPLAYRKSLLMT